MSDRRILIGNIPEVAIVGEPTGGYPPFTDLAPCDDAPPAPTKPAGHQGYLRLLDRMKELHIRKAADYGGDEDPLMNIRRGAQLVGISPWMGAMLRANDKVVRIEQYIRKGSLQNEGVEDSLLDLAAYALLALALFLEEKGITF